MTVAWDDPARLLAAWEDAAAVPEVARGSVLLHAAGLVGDLDEAVDLPLGSSAALAARLYADAFGDALDGVVTCPCGSALEVRLPVAAVTSVTTGDEATVECHGRTLAVRAPTTRDLLEAGQALDPYRTLVRRCVRVEDGHPVDPDSLDEDARRAVDAAAEALSGAAGVVLRATCPDCGRPVSAALDVTGLLWERVAARVPAVLADVATLAMAFGWSEADVLALSPARRRAYLALVGGR